MPEQYTPNLEELVHTQRTLIGRLQDQIRDLQMDLVLAQPQQMVKERDDVVYLRDVKKLSFEKIGQHYGISRQAAQKRYEKAKA